MKFINYYKNNWKVKLKIQFIIIGMLYGYISALNNQNPYYPVKGKNIVSDEYMSEAWHWKPSFFWLPSYILCKVPPGENGIGITHTKSGYLFRNDINRYIYISTSTFLGGIFGLIITILIIKLKHKATLK
jgi:hypothetical protein